MARVSLRFADTQARAAGKTLEGATVEVMTGQAPSSIGATPIGSVLLCSFKITGMRIVANTAVADMTAIAVGDGAPGWYRVRSGNVVLIDGPASDFSFDQLSKFIASGARVSLRYEFKIPTE